ncbi:type II toxin-antitoxin system ParD family antitoxin [Aureimonas populi]|uniref:Type II toxin-antitoxin system ParD family antitoxin n=1 Tax=Aureimonas populi TaxID=1701758 RepID=A0ABW5CQ34_9HYPH
MTEILGGLETAGCQILTIPGSELISVNGELTISVVIARCHHTPDGSYRWRLRFDTSLQPDITIAVRMDAANKAPLDYYLLPRIDLRAGLRLLEREEAEVAALRDRLAERLDQARSGKLAEGTGADAIRRAFTRAKALQ